MSQAQQTLHGKAVKIMDGDTFDLLVDGNTLYRIRLQDIDCPERGQDYYKVAKQALGNYIFNQPIRVVYKNWIDISGLLGQFMLVQKILICRWFKTVLHGTLKVFARY